MEKTLTANTSAISNEDGLDKVSWQYQLLGGRSAISGATGRTLTLTLTLTADQEGDTIQVRVSLNDGKDNAESLTSAATTAVAPKPPPLTVTLSNVPASHDGSSAFTFDLVVQQRRIDR